MERSIEIKGRTIRTGHPTYIVAEMSANHNQDFDTAVKIIEAAKQAGADAIKLQTYTPDTMTIDCDNAYFRVNLPPWEKVTLHELYRKAYMPWEWQPKLQQIANGLGLDLFSTAYDSQAVEFLEQLDMPAFKIASFENVDVRLVRRIARTGKPVLLATGMATMSEIDDAVRTIRDNGGSQVALLKCVSAYPAPAEEMNLVTIPHLAERFSVPVGLSDHTLGIEIPVAAVALGACIVEKHFTITRTMESPDRGFSLEPNELADMVQAIRTTEQALGRVNYEVGELEERSRALRRSLFVVADVKVGEAFSEENVRSIRPGHGLPPRCIDEVIGRRASQDIKRGTPLGWHHVRRA